MSKKSKKKGKKDKAVSHKTKKAKTKKAKTVTRLECSVICLGQMKTGGKVKFESAVQRADNIFCGQPGNEKKSNLKEQAYSMHKATKVLALIGLIAVKGGTVTCLQKVG